MLIEQVEDILDEFNFQRVQDTMKALNWKYFDSPDAYPSIGELRKKARGLLKYAYEAVPSPEYFTGSGGFEVTRYMYPGDSTKYLMLKFVVSTWSNPQC